MKKNAYFDMPMIFILSLLFFTWGLSSQEVIGFDSRFYLFAQEMWRNGPSWFPTTYDQPYPDYTAASTFLIYLFACAVGSLNKLIAVLPTAIAASLTTVMTYLLGARQERVWGICAAGCLLLTVGFVKGASSIALDMYPVLFTTLCFYLVYSREHSEKSQAYGWLFLLFFLGFVFRGPIGLVMPTGIVCSCYLLNRQFKRMLFVGLLSFCLMLICSGVLLALAYHEGANAFMQDVLRMQVFGRMGERFQPVYYYFSVGLATYALSFPLALLSMLGFVLAYPSWRETKHAAFVLKLMAWMFVIVLGMSIPGEKKIRYILPAVPAFALMAAYPFTSYANTRFFTLLRRFLIALFLFLPGIFMVLTTYVYIYDGQEVFDFNIAYFCLLAILSVMQLLSLSLYYRYLNRDALRRSLAVLFAAFSFLIFNKMLVEPVELYVDRGGEFVQAVEGQRLHAKAALVFYKEHPDGMPIKYLMNMPQPIHPVFIQTSQALAAYNSPAFFVTSRDYFMALPKTLMSTFEIIAADKLGHVNIVVFKRKLKNAK